MVMDKQCSKCRVFKSQDDFYKSQRGSRCKECVLEQTREYKRIRRKDFDFKAIESSKQKERRVRLWQNTLVQDSKRKWVIHNLTINDINEMYEEQKGLCFWFKIPLVPSNSKKHPQQPSLDRIDRNKGYTRDNVVLCCYSANIGRNENDIETWKKFLDLLFIK
jgi:hypothetical protein